MLIALAKSAQIVSECHALLEHGHYRWRLRL